MEAKLNFKGSIVVAIVLLAFISFRLVSMSSSSDLSLEKAVRGVLWSSYSGTELSNEIERIGDEEDYDSVDNLVKNASPQAVSILKISVSKPLMSASTNQKVIVKVRYRYPNDSSDRIEYMEFRHGSIGNAWQYKYDVSTISYYLNFF